MPGLWVAGVGLFATNTWILGVIVGDVGAGSGRGEAIAGGKGGKSDAVRKAKAGVEGKGGKRGGYVK